MGEHIDFERERARFRGLDKIHSLASSGQRYRHAVREHCVSMGHSEAWERGLLDACRVIYEGESP